MFINLVNTDIPFEEYQLLTQDQIDALKFRLLWKLQQSIYGLDLYGLDLYGLDLSDFETTYHPYHNNCIILLSIEKRLLFLLVANENCVDECRPFLTIVDMSNQDPYILSDNEMIDLLMDSYKRNPNTSLIPFLALLPNDKNKKIVLFHYIKNNIILFVLCKRKPIGKNDMRHYDYNDDSIREDFCLTDAEEIEVDNIMCALFRKIYHEDYANYIKLIEERNRIIICENCFSLSYLHSS